MTRPFRARPALFAGTLLLGSLLSAPLAAQPESGMRGGPSAQGNAGSRGPEATQQYRQQADERRQEAERYRDERQGSAEQRREEAEAYREQAAQGRADAPNRGAENAPPQRQADPASQGSEQGQAKKQEKSRAWWKFWGD